MTDGSFRVLGVPPALGRELTADEDRVNGPPAAILSHALWVRLFGGDRAVIGQLMTLRGEPYTIDRWTASGGFLAWSAPPWR